MKVQFLSMCAVLATVAFAAPEVREADTGAIPESAGVEFDRSESNWRVTINGFGRFGQRIKMIDNEDGVSGKRNDLFGFGGDLQYRLLEKEDFNLWLSVGGSYAPEQDLATYHSYEIEEGDYGEAIASNMGVKVDVETAEARLMLIPEWQLTESLALGLRAGIGVMRASWKLSAWETTSSEYEDTYGAVGYNGDEYTFVGLLGVQATWMFTENFGVMAYCDGRLGEDVDIKGDFDEGLETIGELKGCGVEFGIGLTAQF